MKLNKKIVSVVLITQTFKVISKNSNVCVAAKTTKKKFDENIKKQFVNTYKFSNHDINIFLFLLLRKDIYPCECMNDWEKLNETSLSEKEDFYSHSIWRITYADYAIAKIVCKDFWSVCLKIYDLIIYRPCSFSNRTMISIASNLKK